MPPPQQGEAHASGHGLALPVTVALGQRGSSPGALARLSCGAAGFAPASAAPRTLAHASRLMSCSTGDCHTEPRPEAQLPAAPAREAAAGSSTARPCSAAAALCCHGNCCGSGGRHRASGGRHPGLRSAVSGASPRGCIKRRRSSRTVRAQHGEPGGGGKRRGTVAARCSSAAAGGGAAGPCLGRQACGCAGSGCACNGQQAQSRRQQAAAAGGEQRHGER